MTLVAEKLMLVEYRMSEKHLPIDPQGSVVIASFTTAQARIKLYTSIRDAGILDENILYFDTGQTSFIAMML